VVTEQQIISRTIRGYNAISVTDQSHAYSSHRYLCNVADLKSNVFASIISIANVVLNVKLSTAIRKVVSSNLGRDAGHPGV
jgi:hypothetical protein